MNTPKNLMQIKICQRSAPVWLMSVLQIRRTIPYTARKAVAKVRKIQAGKEVIGREDMEKAFSPVFSNLNFIVVAGNGPVEKCWAQGQQAAASGTSIHFSIPRSSGGLTTPLVINFA